MNIDDLTIGQAKALASQFGSEQSAGLKSPMIGKYVIVRCKDAGVHAGVLDAASGREAILSESRRLWYWKSKKGSFLSGVARDGIDDTSKVGGPISIHLTETCEIILCTPTAEKSIREIKIHERV